MPVAPRRPCPGKGPRRGRCPNLLSKSEYACLECIPYVKQQIRRYDKARDQGEQRQFIHSMAWRRIRDAKLARDPLCEKHLKQIRDVAAYLVHHIDGNEMNNADENHMSLCNDCHEEIEKGGRWGRSTA
jgi:5-methylcytosine-specific restriction endonuclease McrA